MANTEATVLINLNLEDNASAEAQRAAESFKRVKNNADKFTKSLRLQEIELKKGRDAMMRAKAAMEGATLSELRRMKGIQKSVTELKNKAAAEQMATQAQDAANDEVTQGVTSLDRLIQSLQIQEKQYQESGEAALIYKARLMGADDAQVAQIQSMYQNIQASKHQNEAMGALGKQSRWMRGMFGQLGHQVQDVAVQMQMGTNAMLVFGQQGSQIASLLGPWGSIAGAAISIGAAVATFYSASGQAEKATSELDKAMESLSETIEVDLGKNTRMLTQDFLDLAQTSEALAEITLRQKYLSSLSAVQLAHKEFSTQTQVLLGYVDDLNKVTGDPTSFQRSAAAARNLKEQFGLSAEEAQRLAQAIQFSQLGGEGVEILSDTLVDMATGARSGNTEFVNFATSIVTSLQSMKQAEEQAKFLEEVIGQGLPSAIKKFGDAGAGRTADQLASDLAEIRESLMSEEQKLQAAYLENQRTILLATEEGSVERRDLMMRLTAQHSKELQKLDADNARDSIKLAEKGSRNRIEVLTQENDEMMAEMEKAYNERQKYIEKVTQEAQSIDMDTMAEVDRVRELERQKLEALRLAEEEGIALSRSYADIRKQIAEDTAEAIINARLKEGDFSELEKAQIEGARHRSEFEKKTERDKTSYVLGQLDDQLSGVARYNKKAFALQKAVQIGQAIMNTHTAATKALAAYPPPLNAVFAALAVANGMAQVAQIKSQSYEGGGFTGVGSRSGGVDGRGGFPAILHPNETVIDHTKGQGQGITIINNVDATGSGGDVDQRIRVAMEVTSQQTVKQVQDLLRRQRLV